MKYQILFIIMAVSFLLSKEEHTFKLQNGTKIKGIIMSEDDSIFEVDTEFGLVQIEKKDVRKNEYKVYLKSWNILTGNKISDSKNEFIIDTELGVFKLNKDDYYIAMPCIHNDIFLVIMCIVATANTF